ncbi:I protein [Roseibium sp. TrichSKD4]|uniref:phage protease n=1 Tax=Roseibium sp. TrichSKD4 TaxID=744980 RepID=UPI0001E57607|nr:phage protease [Roseibium sp. TrichSKD4]EFO30942.1 I protein [Roseibium sp. TrichSKD4]
MANQSTQLGNLCLALNSTASGQAPDWIELLPAGQAIVGYDGRTWINDNPQKLIDRFAARPSPLPIDFEHASEREPDGRAIDVAGHITELEIRDGGSIWGKSDWSELGRNKVEGREYRHISPAFWFNRSGHLLELTSAALTLDPNLKLTALNRSQRSVDLDTHHDSEGTSSMDKEQRKALCRKLGLADEASDNAILDKVGGLAEDRDKALNRAEHPDLQKFVPRADYDKVKGDLEKAENSAKERLAQDAESVVDQAIKDGKITPASKDYHLATCRASADGLKAFQDFIGKTASTSLADSSGLEDKDPAQKATLSRDQKAIASQLGIPEEEYAKELKAASNNGGAD